MALSFEQREDFCLQQEGFSLTDITIMTHCKQETIKTRLRYAKTKLKALLEQAYD
ncbi:MAG: RNA polymerase sigma-70 factor (ECF subfamily) [Glaciecola sp.]|jgi:RNA polymerase sigma-70 factor (ECF subfamily)